MEIKLSGLTLLLLGIVLLGLVAGDPEPVLPADEPVLRELAALEDAFARRHDDLALANRLAGEYLRLEQPGLAIGVVRQVSPDLSADPLLTHRLAQGYEALGRVHDALATAHLARTRCERAAGTDRSQVFPGTAAFACTPGVLVALEQHEGALLQMVRWGVEDPRNDPRARMAHRVAARHVRITSAQR